MVLDLIQGSFWSIVGVKENIGEKHPLLFAKCFVVVGTKFGRIPLFLRVRNSTSGLGVKPLCDTPRAAYYV